MTVTLIGLTGVAGAGKDTAAQTLIDQGWVRVSFADPLREMLLALDPLITYRGCAVLLSSLIKQYGWDEVKRGNTEVRRLLQRLGTEVGRNLISPNFWTDQAEKKINDLLMAEKNVVITDVRFANEAELIHRYGGKVIKIERSGVDQVRAHSSETLDFSFDRIVHNDGDIQYLYDQIREAIR